MRQAKKLIEVALPLDAINAASAREKSIRHGHPSTLHLWWARRPLAAARAVIFTSLVDDPDDPDANPAFVQACGELPGDGPNVSAKGDSPRMRLFDFIERLVTWEATTDETIMGQARALIRIATDGKPPPLLDPFAGGGSIPLEAQRLGLEAHASDLNPVAVMINKAMIEIPPRFADMPPVNPRDRKSIFATEAQRARGDSLPIKSRRGDSVSRPQWKGAAGLAADVRYYGEWMRERAFERIGHLYPKHKGETVIAWLWARTVISPNPAVNAPVPLVRSFVLSKKKGRECWAKPVIEGTSVRFEVTEGKPPRGEDGTIIPKQGARCLVSGEPIPFGYIRAEGIDGRIGAQLKAIVTKGSRRRKFYSAPKELSDTPARAGYKWKPVGSLPEKHRSISAQLYGLDEFHKLFTERQLVALTTFSDLVQEARSLAFDDSIAAGMSDDRIPLRASGNGALAYCEAVSVYLSFIVDRAADFWGSLARWRSDNEQVVNVFGRQAIPMLWDYAEANPFGDAAGNFRLFIESVAKSVMRFNSRIDGLAKLSDAVHVNAEDAFVSTDPPYYDNIGYSDLSDYFYVWMRQNLAEVYPDVFRTVLSPKNAELIASSFRRGGKDNARQFFETGMLQTFSNLRRHVRYDYPLSIYYAFKQQDAKPIREGDSITLTSTGWETMLISLITAGFSIDGTWPLRTEGGTRMNAQGTNALASSIVLVCRPRPEDAPATSRRRFLNALRAELPPAIAEMKTGSIAPVDLAQASIGPGMAIYSRYRAVLEADGTPLTVRAALGLINEALEETLEDAVANLDAETRFAIDWFTQKSHRTGDFGEANTLAQSKNTAVESVALAGLVEAKAGKVRLFHWKEYDPGDYDPAQDQRPTVWEGTHHLIERLNHHGEMGAAALYNKLPGDIAASARDLAYRLYHICERKSWAEDALDYNVLVSSWSEITRLAASREASGTTQDMFGG